MTVTLLPAPTAPAQPVVADRRLPAGDLAAIAVLAVLVRVLLAVLSAKSSHLSLAEQAYVNDGEGYVHYGQWVAGQRGGLTDYESRLFPGMPMAIALGLKLGLAPHWAAFLPGWLGAAAAAVGGAVLFRRTSVGWFLAFLLPDALLTSSVVASEGLMLGLSVWGLVLARRGHPVAAGLLLGLAGVVRPMACFAVGGFVIAELWERRWRRAAVVALVSLAVVALALFWLHHHLGSALTPARTYRDNKSAYRGELLCWPFQSLVYYSLHYPIGRAKVAFVWGHVAFVFAAVVLLARRVRHAPGDTLAKLSLAWVAFNTLFCLCVGSVWGFLCFPRFLTPALPGTAYAFDRWLPDRWYGRAAMAAASLGVALAMIGRRQ